MTTIKIPTRMRPQPWLHLKAWLAGNWVYTHEFVDQHSMRNTRDEVDYWKREYEKAQGRIDALILEHQPVLRDPISGGWSAALIKLKCASPNCPFMWPCPQFQWATGKRYEPLILTEIKGDKEDDR